MPIYSNQSAPCFMDEQIKLKLEVGAYPLTVAALILGVYNIGLSGGSHDTERADPWAEERL